MTTIRPPKALSILVASCVLLVLLAALFFMRGSTSAASPGVTDASKKALPAAPAAGCWLAVSIPNPANSGSTLAGISAVNTNDVWAAGYSTGNMNTSPLIEHWNGISWSIVPNPPIGTFGGGLNAIAANTDTDIWAVGWAVSSGATDTQPLALHWDGAQWSRVRTPTFVGSGGALTSVTVLSANDAWAVGDAFNYYLPDIMLHWDGRQWSSVTFPAGASLAGVSGIAPDDVWAVGYNTVIHWDGTHWRTVIVPEPPNGWCDSHLGWSLNSVSERAPNDVWSAGYCYSREAGLIYPLVLHWDGALWTYYPIHLDSALDVELTAIDAVASGDAWAVVFRNDGSPNFVNQSVAVHWDGTQWTQADTPQQGTGPNSFA